MSRVFDIFYMGGARHPIALTAAGADKARAACFAENRIHLPRAAQTVRSAVSSARLRHKAREGTALHK